MKRCVLHAEKVCNDCGECDDRCDLDPDKICDNCFRCLEEGAPAYMQIPISGVFLEDDCVQEPECMGTVEWGDGFVPDRSEDWNRAEPVCVKTLPMTYGARVRRARPKR